MGNICIKCFSLWLCNAAANFQRAVLAIFVDLIHECVEVYIDDFTVYGGPFYDCLTNLEKNLKWRICVDYRESNKATLKCHFPLPFIDQVLD